jgi:hypothetical protein
MSIIWFQSLDVVSHYLIQFSTWMAERTFARGAQAFVASSASISKCSPSAPSTAASSYFSHVELTTTLGRYQ